MLTAPDRRTRQSRRGAPRVEEALERKAKAPRRREDRRDWARVPRIILVREAGSSRDFEKSPGDLSVGGVRWRSDAYPSTRHVEVCVRVPGYALPVRALATILRVEILDDELQLHAEFDDLSVKAQLAIARFIDSRVKLASVVS